jgi:hypothetical protein
MMATKEIQKTARIAGLLYLSIAILAPLGDMLVRQSLIVPGDAAATARNIAASEGLFRLGFVSDLVVQTIHVFLVAVLFTLLKPVNKNQALLMVFLGLLGVPIAMLSGLNLTAALLLSSRADYLTAFAPGQLQALVPLFLDLHEQGVFIAQIFWGLWLFPLGYLVFKSGYIPRLLGVLLIIGGFGYLIDCLIVFLIPSLDVTVSLFTFWGEVLLPLWLLIKGVKVEQWERRALESA